MCPIVPTFTCGFDRSNFSFAIFSPQLLLVPVDLTRFLVIHEVFVLQRAVGGVQLHVTPHDVLDSVMRAAKPAQPLPWPVADPHGDAVPASAVLDLDDVMRVGAGDKL